MALSADVRGASALRVRRSIAAPAAAQTAPNWTQRIPQDYRGRLERFGFRYLGMAG